MRGAVVAAVVLGSLLCLSACGDNASTGPTATGNGAPSGAGDTRQAITSVDPCALLTPADVPELNQNAAPTSIGSAEDPTCVGDDFMVQISNGANGIHDLRFAGPVVRDLPDIDGHKAGLRQTTVDGATNCGVVLEVTSTQLVQVFVTLSDPTTACTVARRAAAVVVSRLPG